MIEFILFALIILWLLGFVHVPILSAILFSLFNHPFTLHNLLLLILIAVIINLLPGIFKTIGLIILVLWLLSTFGVFLVGGLANILIIALIVAVILSIF